jgi:malonate-semialdehyde dehydrogenase (acetylating)/methylmalonate-semialdehyde dehydrogenase
MADQSSASATTPDTVRNYVDGAWTDVVATDEATVMDPATGETITTTPFSSEDAVDEAVEAAVAAFESWRELPPVDRVQYLFEFKAELEARETRLATALSREHGKTVGEAKGEIRRGIENVEVATGIPNMLREGSGVVEGVASGLDESAVRQPLGVFAAVTPFNFPAMIPLWFLPYAVATGNTFVLKPSERVPLSSQIIFEALDATGLPGGVASLINGSANTVTALLEHPDVEGISFVGSSPVAQHIYETAASNGKRVQAQGGAKNYAVITESAVLDEAVPNVVGSVYGNAGQRCLANDVVVAVGDVYYDLRPRLVEAVKDLTVGPGSDASTDVGPMITPESRERVINLVVEAVKEGADLIVDGRDYEHPSHPKGNYLGPILLDDVDPDSTIAQEEIFGPVLCLTRAADLDEAIKIVNGTRYGNASSIFTEKGGEARRYRYSVDAGNIGINVGVCAPMGFFHFGGRKASFFGDLHAQGEDSVAFYTEKTIQLERWYN